jgi:alpha-ketoglutarate-dependent taurine dioxygenase
MARPLGLFLRSTRRGLPRVFPHIRGYAANSPQSISRAGAGTEGNPDNRNATPSNSPDNAGFSTQPGPLTNFIRETFSTITEVGTRRVRLTLPSNEKNVDEPKVIELDYLQLRDACTCPRCVDPHSKQRNFRTSDIPAKVRPRRMRWIDHKLEVLWKDDIPGFDDSHVSLYRSNDLQFPLLFASGSSSRTRTKLLWNKEIMERVQHWITYDEYMNDDARFAKAMRSLARYGLIFVKDIPDSREMVEKIATRIGPLRNTFYGMTWDVRTVPEAKNVAYTNQNLGFHMDLMYMNEPPGFQLLHCIKNSCEGGESLFADTLAVASSLSDRYIELLKEFKLNYHYEHKDQIYHNSWPVIEARMTGREESGKVLWAIDRCNYSPPFQARLRSPDGQPLWSYELLEYYRALRRFSTELEKEFRIFQLKLKPGECVIFENRRIVHARRAFDTATGERWLAGAYVDEDAVLSRFGVLRRDQNAWREYMEEEQQLLRGKSG